MLKKSFENIENIKQIYKKYIIKHKKYLILAILMMILVAITTAFLGFITKPVINDIFIKKNIKMLYLVCILYLSSSVIKAFATYFQNTLIFLIQEKVINEIRSDIFKRIIKLNMQSFEKIGKGRILTIMNGDLIMITENFAPVFLTTFRDIATVAFLLSMTFYQNPTLAIIALSIFPIALMPLKKVGKSIRKKYKDTQIKQDIMTNTVTEILNGIKTIKSYSSEDFEIRRFNLLLKKLFQVSFSFKKKGSFGSPFMEFIGGLSTVLVILYGGFLVINNKSDAGTFFSFLISIILAYKPAKSLSGIGLKTNMVNISAGRILDLLKEGELDKYNLEEEDVDLKKEIRFENVSFSYSLKEEDRVIENISFSIKPGEKVAFVGLSGSGKSTIIDLLMGFYEKDSGKILIGEKEISSCNVKNLRKNIGYISQDSFLFEGNINHNIVYNTRSQKSIDLEEAKNISAIDFKENENDSMNLSIGQKQRIGIARALYKNPQVLILDESTSALDALSEKKIISNIFQNMKEKTVIMIAHRLHILPECDKIYLLNKGKIIEQGTHHELLQNKDGLYKKMWETMQNRDF